MTRRDGEYLPLYVPQGVLILSQQRDLQLATTSERFRAKRRPAEDPPYAPVENEGAYAVSTRERWPKAWRTQGADDASWREATQRQLKLLCRAKDAQAARDEYCVDRRACQGGLPAPVHVVVRRSRLSQKGTFLERERECVCVCVRA